jgi:hypothetical protein
MIAVPRGPAGDTAKSGMLTARHERSAALLTAPDISHYSHAPHERLRDMPASTI